MSSILTEVKETILETKEKNGADDEIREKATKIVNELDKLY